MLTYHKKWRFINSGAYSASFNMALDEAISISVRKGDSPPTLRLYSWDRTSVSIGCFQKIKDINIEYCQSKDIPVVRRPTGGRAIIHSKELTYSFSVRNDHEFFSGSLLDSYKNISMAFNIAFREIGIEAESKKQRERGSVLKKSPLCFQSSSFGEILIGNKKIAGSAQKRWTDGLLQQGSIPYYIEELLIKHIFGPQYVQDMKEAMTGLKEALPALDEEKFKAAIRISFEKLFNAELVTGLPCQEEEALALKLASEKYQAAGWNFRQ